MGFRRPSGIIEEPCGTARRLLSCRSRPENGRGDRARHRPRRRGRTGERARRNEGEARADGPVEARTPGAREARLPLGPPRSIRGDPHHLEDPGDRGERSRRPRPGPQAGPQPGRQRRELRLPRPQRGGPRARAHPPAPDVLLGARVGGPGPGPAHEARHGGPQDDGSRRRGRRHRAGRRGDERSRGGPRAPRGPDPAAGHDPGGRSPGGRGRDPRPRVAPRTR